MTAQTKGREDPFTQELRSLGEAIREKREAVGLTLTELAQDETGERRLSHTWLSNLETGQVKNPSRERLTHVERRLGVPEGAYLVRLTRARRLADTAPGDDADASLDREAYRFKPFAIVYQEVSYIFESGRTPRRWRSVVVVRPEFDNMEVFRARCLYTGDVSRLSFHPLFGIADFGWMPPMVTNFREMAVELERPVQLGATGSLAYEWEVEDGTEPLPFVTAGYERPTTGAEHLILRVFFAPDALPARIYEYDSAYSHVEEPDTPTRGLELAASGQYEREVFDAQAGRRYGFKWEW